MVATIAVGRRWWRSAATASESYWTNSLYSTWDDQFYVNGVPAAMVKADVGETGGLTLDEKF